MATLRKLMLSLPDYFSRVPDNSFIILQQEEQKGHRFISGMRGDSWALVHLPTGGSVMIDLIKAFPQFRQHGRFRTWWLDPKDGSRRVQDRGETSAIVGCTTREAPSSGCLDSDWVLLLEAVRR